MCGRYVLACTCQNIADQLTDAHINLDTNFPPDDLFHQTYNFAPGSDGIVLLAKASLPYNSSRQSHLADDISNESFNSILSPHNTDTLTENLNTSDKLDVELRVMKWGFIPPCTKHTSGVNSKSFKPLINCRADTLQKPQNIWSKSHAKRCIVICNGYYEWLSSANSKNKSPYYIRRKDRNLLFMPGMWGSSEGIDGLPIFTYSVVTVCSNDALKFLHHRMPVIFDANSDAIKTWLDPKHIKLTPELHDLLRPYGGSLEFYPVSRDVGKVGTNSPSFILPLNEPEKKRSIIKFFSNCSNEISQPLPQSIKLTNVIDLSFEGANHASKDKLHLPDNTSPGKRKRESSVFSTKEKLVSRHLPYSSPSERKSRSTKKANCQSRQMLNSKTENSKLTSFFKSK